MRRGGGKQKGSAFERKLCKELSLWVSHGKNEDLFWRSAMSGGRATVAARKGKTLNRQAGDISSVSPEGHVLTDPYYIEAKHIKDVNIESFVVKEAGTLQGYWTVAVKEASSYKKQPLLIVRQNRLPTLLLCSPGTVYDMVGRRTRNPAFRASIRIHGDLVEMWLWDDILKYQFIG